MKLPKNIMYVPTKGAAPEDIKPEDFLKLLAKEHGQKNDDYFKGLVSIALDPDGLELSEDDKTAAEIKSEKKIIAAITKAFSDSEKLIAKAKVDEEKAEATKAKEGELIILAAHKGSQLSTGVVGNTVSWLQKAVGEKFVVSTTGLKLAKGAAASTEDMALLISGLSQTDGNMDAAKMTVMWSLGDALLLAKKTAVDEEAYERLLENAVSEFGKAKHTIQQAVRVAEFFPPMHRDVPGWTYTHFQEFLNYSQSFENPDDLFALMARLAKGKDASITVNKKNLNQTVPLSCAEIRAELQEKTGKKPGSGSKGGGISSPKYIYAFINENGEIEILSSEDCSMMACADETYTVIDVKLNALMDSEGNVAKHLKPLPKKWFKEVPTEKAEETPVEDSDELPV